MLVRAHQDVRRTTVKAGFRGGSGDQLLLIRRSVFSRKGPLPVRREFGSQIADRIARRITLTTVTNWQENGIVRLAVDQLMGRAGAGPESRAHARLQPLLTGVGLPAST